MLPFLAVAQLMKQLGTAFQVKEVVLCKGVGWRMRGHGGYVCCVMVLHSSLVPLQSCLRRWALLDTELLVSSKLTSN